jgi:hypothetical protein
VPCERAAGNNKGSDKKHDRQDAVFFSNPCQTFAARFQVSADTKDSIPVACMKDGVTSYQIAIRQTIGKQSTTGTPASISAKDRGFVDPAYREAALSRAIRGDPQISDCHQLVSRVEQWHVSPHPRDDAFLLQ